MSAKFGGTSFYEYHKAFSARAAELLTHYNVNVDWSRRDNNLICSIFAGHKANACSVCNSIAHTTEFCQHIAKSASSNLAPSSKSKKSSSAAPSSNDRQGRAKSKSAIILIHNQVANEIPAGTSIYVSNAKSLITF